jgi:hypothetical protein
MKETIQREGQPCIFEQKSFGGFGSPPVWRAANVTDVTLESTAQPEGRPRYPGVAVV